MRAQCSYPERHIVVPLDLVQSATFPGIVECVIEQVGAIDILINNGGVSQRSLAVETPLDVDRRIMEVNYFGTVALTKAVLPSMLEKQAGRMRYVFFRLWKRKCSSGLKGGEDGFGVFVDDG